MAPANPFAPRRLVASAEDAGRRLDLYLASRLPELSRTRIQELIDEGRVHVGERLPRRAQRVATGDVIDIEVLQRPPLEAEPEEIPLELLREDDDFVVVNKPAGMVVHAGAGVSHGTLVNALLHRLGALSTAGGARASGNCSPTRSRHVRGAGRCAQRFRASRAGRTISRPNRAQNLHRAAARAPGARLRDHYASSYPRSSPAYAHDRAVKKGREARTDWRVLLRLGNFTLVAAEPRTGRTHQIRAHFAAIGHPLVGDTLYGAPERARAARVLLPELERVFLHAARLQFAHPRTGVPVDVRAPLDRGLRAYLAELATAVEDRAAQH